MVTWKKYDVCIPRKYKDRAGDEKTHFWKVGTMTPMQNRDGFTLMLYTNLLVIPKDTNLVAFRNLQQVADERENKQPEDDADPDMDDIPF